VPLCFGGLCDTKSRKLKVKGQKAESKSEILVSSFCFAPAPGSHMHAPTYSGRIRDIAVPRTIVFALLITASVIVFLAPLQQLLSLSNNNADYSYIPLIPVIVLGLLWLERREVFKRIHYSWRAGGLITIAGIAVARMSAGLSSQLGVDDRLFVAMLGLVTIWIGSFAFSFGTDAARAGLFALLFGLLLVPPPHAIIAKPLEIVQYGSAGVTGFLFSITGAPVFRDGLTFSLPHLTFVVTTECSGIHSTLRFPEATEIAEQSGFSVALLCPVVTLPHPLMRACLRSSSPNLPCIRNSGCQSRWAFLSSPKSSRCPKRLPAPWQVDEATRFQASG
jgi:exosortase